MQISNDTRIDFTPHAQSLGQPMAALSDREHPPYFSAASRRTTLDMALYLARYSDLVLLIHGPAGSGKSTLLGEMIARGGPNIHAITVSADRTLTTQTICDAVLHSFKLVAMQPAPAQPVAQIKEQLDLLQRKGYHCILFIDDADRLASDAYPFLEALADLRSDTGRNLLNLVLFTEHREKISLVGPSVRHRVKATELHPLAADEVGAYVQHVQRSNITDGNAVDFQARDIQRIARASAGWPGNINALIAQRSARELLRLSPAAILLNHPWATPRHVLGATAIAVALIVVFVFQDSVNHLFETPPPVASQTVIAPPQALAPIQAVATPEPEEETAPVPVSPALPPTEMIAAAPEPAPAEPAVPLAPDVTPALSPGTNKPAVNRAATPQRHDWLLAQNPDAYTLQIAGSSQEDDIRRALKKFNLTDPAAVFSASRKGKPWFGLVTGVYADFASAKQARAALPNELMRGAWVRRLSAVQSEINKPQEAAETLEQTTGTAAATSQPVTPTQLP